MNDVDYCDFILELNKSRVGIKSKDASITTTTISFSDLEDIVWLVEKAVTLRVKERIQKELDAIKV